MEQSEGTSFEKTSMEKILEFLLFNCSSELKEFSLI
jgi:hypothetical protein